MAQLFLSDEARDNALLAGALRGAACIAAAVHVAFFALFSWLGLSSLALLNVGSVAIFATARWLFGLQRLRLAMTLMSVEIVVHAAAAVVTLGLGSGFQYYLFAVVAPVAVVGHATRSYRLLGICAVAISFELVDFAMQQRAPLAVINPFLLAGLSTLNVCGTVVILAFVASFYARLISKSQASLHVLATTDPLTGLSNRRQLMSIARSRENDPNSGTAAHCVLLCDIDNFKAVNDRHGHDVGDRALEFVATILSATIRPGDSIARWGGEEFLALMSDAEIEIALHTAERLRTAIGSAPFSVCAASDHSINMTITIGVAAQRENEGIEATIARADAALYRGKSEGRNCVRHIGEPEMA